MTKWKICTKHFVTCWNTPVQAELTTFFMEHHFDLRDLLIDKLPFTLIICRYFLEKWTKWACHFKEKKAQKLVLMVKLGFHREIRMFENLHLPLGLKIFPVLKNVFDKIVMLLVNVVFILYSKKVHQHLENLHNSIFSIFQMTSS